MSLTLHPSRPATLGCFGPQCAESDGVRFSRIGPLSEVRGSRLLVDAERLGVSKRSRIWPNLGCAVRGVLSTREREPGEARDARMVGDGREVGRDACPLRVTTPTLVLSDFDAHAVPPAIAMAYSTGIGGMAQSSMIATTGRSARSKARA